MITHTKKSMIPAQHYTTVAPSELHNPPLVTHSSIVGPTHHEIACRAYDIYIKTGRVQGQCKQNWSLAEKSLHEQNMAACQFNQSGSGASTKNAGAIR